MPVPAILAGLGFRGAVAGRLGTSPDVDMFVDVDMALPGLELLKCPPGVAFPDREPGVLAGVELREPREP